MPYATVADVTAAIGADFLLAIADHNRDGVVDTDVVERALSEASNLADTYIKQQLVPPYPDALRRAVVDIAAYKLRAARDRITKDSALTYRSAIDWLRDVGTGKAELTPAGEADPGDPVVVAEDRLWTRRSARRLL